MHQHLLKYFCLLFTIPIFCPGVFAQKSFEGRIVYRFTQPNENKIGSIEAFFGKKKIFAHITDSSKDAIKNDILLDFENGGFYSINRTTKEYSKEKITDQKRSVFPGLSRTPGREKTVLGLRCSAYTGTDSSAPATAIAWYADSLHFFFDEKYVTNEMLPVFGNGKNIAMGFEVNTKKLSRTVHLISTPILIEAKEFPDSLFILPVGYKLKWEPTQADSTEMASQMVLDSLKRHSDSIKKEVERLELELKQLETENPPLNNTHKQPTKSPAIKPKQ